ncbi:hypothetical protein A8O37_30855 [Pseudomonas aeruginosa]|nr:hypothetical protein A8O37_30855 [Pseudomonas aeruginosa]
MFGVYGFMMVFLFLSLAKTPRFLAMVADVATQASGASTGQLSFVILCRRFVVSDQAFSFFFAHSRRFPLYLLWAQRLTSCLKRKAILGLAGACHEPRIPQIVGLKLMSPSLGAN